MSLTASTATAQSQVITADDERLDAVNRLTRWAAGGWRLGYVGSLPGVTTSGVARLWMPEMPAAMRLGRVVAATGARRGTGQGASQTVEADQVVSNTSLSGYMDFHFNNREHEDPVIDFHRFVLLFTHSFS
ncbi:MAG: hypothetical protein ABGY72_04760, partial [bacterium]